MWGKYRTYITDVISQSFNKYIMTQMIDTKFQMKSQLALSFHLQCIKNTVLWCDKAIAPQSHVVSTTSLIWQCNSNLTCCISSLKLVS